MPLPYETRLPPHGEPSNEESRRHIRLGGVGPGHSAHARTGLAGGAASRLQFDGTQRRRHAEAEVEVETDAVVGARGRRSTNPTNKARSEITVLGRPSERPKKFQTIPEPARPNTPIAANSGPISLGSKFFIRAFWRVSGLCRESVDQTQPTSSRMLP